FVGQNLAQLCNSIQTDPPRPLHEVRPDVPPALQAIVTRCLSKEPADRFASATDLAAALAAISTAPDFAPPVETQRLAPPPRLSAPPAAEIEHRTKRSPSAPVLEEHVPPPVHVVEARPPPNRLVVALLGGLAVFSVLIFGAALAFRSWK